MSRVNEDFTQNQTIKNVRQAIVYVRGTDQNELAKAIALGTIEMTAQYDTKNTGYVGNYEHGKWKFVLKAWLEQGFPQDVYVVDSYDDIEEVAMMAELETVPMNNYSAHNQNLLILGPFDSKRLAFLTQNFTAL